jgi:hypothetical protein
MLPDAVHAHPPSPIAHVTVALEDPEDEDPPAASDTLVSFWFAMRTSAVMSHIFRPLYEE